LQKACLFSIAALTAFKPNPHQATKISAGTEFQLVLGPDRKFEDAVAVARVSRFSTPFAAVFGFGFAVAF
jgi:hypothetical protein